MSPEAPRGRPGRGSEVSERVRWRLLQRLERRLELPMGLLGIGWLALFVVEMVRGLDPLLGAASVVIWVLFILEYGLRLAVAPRRLAYVRRSWLTALSLALPALRVLRVTPALRLLRAARAMRGARLIRAVASLNRTMGALSTTMRKRGAIYVALLTCAVVVGGSAGMLALERGRSSGFESYGDALWWTAMIVTTMGSGSWPATSEGRALAVLLSLYAIGVFGFVTAALASFFIGRDAAPGGELPSASDVRALRREVSELREELSVRRAERSR